jgi:hypothetical protein
MTNQIDSDLLAAVLQLLTPPYSSNFAEGHRLLVNEATFQERSAERLASPLAAYELGVDPFPRCAPPPFCDRGSSHAV